MEDDRRSFLKATALVVTGFFGLIFNRNGSAANNFNYWRTERKSGKTKVKGSVDIHDHGHWVRREWINSLGATVKIEYDFSRSPIPGSRYGSPILLDKIPKPEKYLCHGPFGRLETLTKGEIEIIQQIRLKSRSNFSEL